MANIFKSILDAMKFSDEDDEESYDEYVNSVNEKETKRAERQEKEAQKKVEREEKKAVVTPVVRKEEPKPRVVAESRKVIPVRTMKDYELSVVKPTSFSDCQDICDILLSGDAVIINFEDFDTELSQRVIDFVSGTVYAIKGSISPISKMIYVVSPENVNISGDVLNLLANGSVEVPTISKDF